MRSKKYELKMTKSRTNLVSEVIVTQHLEGLKVQEGGKPKGETIQEFAPKKWILRLKTLVNSCIREIDKIRMGIC